MKYDAWEKLAHRYNDQWVQKYSLRPTRRDVKKIVLPLLEKNNNMKILDIGCGTGQLAKEISDEYPFVDYLGIDVTKNMISLAKKSNDGKKVRFINTSVDDFICDERFDIIICTHAFPYFPNKEKAMSKMYKLCKEGGKVIIVSSSTNNLKDLLANLIVKTKTGRAKYLSVKQMKHLLSCAGFTVKSVDVIRERTYMPTIALFYAEK
ncbi:MAG: class I SAM-dependent methyltransferase [Clostridia bacterium]|nr:class I SAM-dependent methyltransferase [Clostridia bacterium]